MVALLVLASLLSAALLFAVQPMAGKMALPLLGGGAGVWTTCMLFFQVGLLAGYAWAHQLGRRCSLRAQVLLHGTVAVVALFTLPPAFDAASLPAADASPSAWLLAALASGFGLPTVTLAATGPLLQRWFSATNDARAADPYFLFAASNAGSLLGLLAYPFVLEKTLPLRAGTGLPSQAGVWSAAFGALVALIVAAGTWAARRSAPSVAVAEEPRATSTWPTCARWALLAFVPSSTVLGVTQYLTTDIAAIPLLWIVPLAIYLLTFILAFSPRARMSIPKSGIALCVLGVVAAVEFHGSVRMAVPLIVIVHLGALAAVGVFCHGRLAGMRPDRAQLTRFYLWIALGGCFGGVFNAILAPALFDSIAEYPIVLALAAFLVPDSKRDALTPRGRLNAVAIDAGAALSIGAAVVVGSRLGAVSALVPCALTLALLPWPRRFAFVLACLFGATWMSFHAPWTAVHRDRTFYGVHRIVETKGPGRMRVLVDGVTRHGSQSLDPGRRRIPTTYYHPSGPLGDVVRGLRARGPIADVGLIGLGAGTAAAYGEPGEHFTYFEIDPAVARLASDPRLFTYIADSRARVDIVLGDGRLRIADCADERFDLIVLDAFSSDAIPVHLLTREAVASYLQKLKPRGCLAVHLTNGYLALEPVVAAIASELRIPSAVKRDTVLTAQQAFEGKDRSQWAVLLRDGAAAFPVQERDGWMRTPANLGAGSRSFLWTDDRSNLVELLVRGIHGPSR